MSLRSRGLRAHVACFCPFGQCNLPWIFATHKPGSTHMNHSLLTAVALAGAALAADATIATAQNYPTKPIRFIATEVVGSATDIQARIIAKGMAQVLGQPIEIENLFGEAGVVKGIHSPPDGYTIVYGGAGTLALLPHIKKVSYDGQKALSPGR